LHGVVGDGGAGEGLGAGTVEGRVGTGRNGAIIESKRRVVRIVIFSKVLLKVILVSSLLKI
jgi:hypothetical protein